MNLSMDALQKVEIAREVVEGMPCLGGWAAVFFPSAQDAAEYLSTYVHLKHYPGCFQSSPVVNTYVPTPYSVVQMTVVQRSQHLR